MQRDAVFIQGICELARRLRIAVVEVGGGAENFEVVNSGVGERCEQRGRERLVRVHVSGKNAVHPAPWHFGDQPWSTEIDATSIALAHPAVARGAKMGSGNPRYTEPLDLLTATAYWTVRS